MTGRILIKGPFSPPSALLYPNGRKTAHHVYQLFDGAGRKLMGGMGGADLDALITRVKGYAAEKGLPSVTLEIVPA